MILAILMMIFSSYARERPPDMETLHKLEFVDCFADDSLLDYAHTSGATIYEVCDFASQLGLRWVVISSFRAGGRSFHGIGAAIDFAPPYQDTSDRCETYQDFLHVAYAALDYAQEKNPRGIGLYVGQLWPAIHWDISPLGPGRWCRLHRHDTTYVAIHECLDFAENYVEENCQNP